MNNLLIKLVLSGLVLSAIMSCEDQIFPKLDEAQSILVVDAWISNKPGQQQIKLTRTQPYFENLLPPGVSGATVTVQDSNGKIYSFTENATPGIYSWIPASASEVFGEVGLDYTLRVTTNTQVFEATSSLRRAPVVDSITFLRDPGNDFVNELFFAEFWSTDPEGEGDYYWIRAYKNGTLLNKPAEINLSIDGAFSEQEDSLIFIAPIRTAINSFEQDANNNVISPLSLGDSVYVEVNSISQEAHFFLTQVQTQTNRQGGFGELFAPPLANLPTNIRNTNGNSPVVGFFNVSALTSGGRKFKSRDEAKDN